MSSDNFYNHCRNNNVEAALKMLKNGEKDYHGGFIAFCKCGNLKMVKYMLNLCERNVDLNYAFRVSCKYGNLDVVIFLLEAGARDIKNGLYFAKKENQELVEAYLLLCEEHKLYT